MVAVDLMPLKPGGENGGLKPALFSLLRAVREKSEDRLVYVFLTDSEAHFEVREFAQPADILICIGANFEEVIRTARGSPREFGMVAPPEGFLEAIEVDLLYCPFGAATFHSPNIPTVALIADLLHRDHPASLSECEIAHREKYLQKTMQVAAKLQSLSSSGASRLVKHYQVPPEKLFWTYLPIHDRLKGQLASGAPLFVSSRPFFFYPANVWPHKNHELLLRSYASYRETAGDTAWDLVLTFHESPRALLLKSLAQSLGLTAHVRFEGFVSEAKLHGIWQNAGALVFPSLHEGFGIPLLEAMYYGVPIITGNDFSLPEVSGDARYFVDSRDPASLAAALLEVSRNSQLRGDLIARGRARLQLFDLNIAAGSLLDVFRSVSQKDGAFPRRAPTSLPVLSVPTPASAERWKVDLTLEATPASERILVNLNEILFASWYSIPAQPETHSFFCRPQGRLLSVHLESSELGKSSSSGGVAPLITVVATSKSGERVLLYQRLTKSLRK